MNKYPKAFDAMKEFRVSNTRSHKHPMPPDPEEMNQERAGWAQAALETFCGRTGTDPSDAVSDLIADLMHWCDRTGSDWNSELARGMTHYNEETTEQP
jgi:hypothetical protein